MARAGSATRLVESNALSEELAECAWLASCFGLAKALTYDVRKRDKLNREFSVVSVMSDDNDSELRASAICDAKSIYGNPVREHITGADRRSFRDLRDPRQFEIIK